MPVAMRMVWFLGWMAMISTARAQPAPPDVPSDSALPADAPPDGAPPADAPSPPLPLDGAPPASADPESPPSVAPLRTPALASAAPGAASPPAAEPEVEYEHYGWQIVIADAATTVLFVNGQGKPGLALYALAGPMIHGAHEQAGRAMGSLALRLGLPVLSAWTWGWYAHSGCAPHDDDCETDGAVAIGLVLGFATAMVLDATVLAHAAKPRRTASATWMPQVTATPQRVALGVLGRF